MRRGSRRFSLESGIAVLLAWLLTIVYSASGAGTITNLTESALQAALKSGGTARFGAGGTIILTNTLLITTNTILDANGNSVTISGGNSVRIFQVATNVTFQLRGVTLADGRVVGTNGTSGGQNVQGACILSLGGNLIMNTCTLTNCYLKGGDSTNAAKGGDALGAAIFCIGGYLKATNSHVIGSTASGGSGSAAGNGPAGQALGAAIYSERSTTILEGVNLTDNIVEGGLPGRGGAIAGGPGGLAAGGGIYASNSSVIIYASAFTNNTVMGGGTPYYSIVGLPSGDGLGGAVFLSSGSTGVIQRAFFTSNAATGGNGGKFFASGAGRGGAVFSAGHLGISESTFANNNSTGGYSGSGAAPGQGGGVCSTGELELTGCALLSNYAIGGDSNLSAPAAGQGGGIWSSGTLAATNSTVTANDVIGGENITSSGGGPGGQGNGGGICITGGSATLINLTIASNRADPGTNWATALPSGVAQGGGIVRHEFYSNTSQLDSGQ
jgi:hypothetical protein